MESMYGVEHKNHMEGHTYLQKNSYWEEYNRHGKEHNGFMEDKAYLQKNDFVEEEHSKRKREDKMSKKPAPVVQILKWQGKNKEWIVIDLVPETTSTEFESKSGRTSPKSKLFEKTRVKIESKKAKPCFCFDWRGRVFSVAQCIKRVEDIDRDIKKVEDIQKVEEIDRDITKDIERSIEKMNYVENRKNNPHSKNSKLISRNQRLNEYETEGRKQKYDEKVLLPPTINLNARDERNRRNKAASAISEPTEKYETPEKPTAKDFKAKANLKLAKKDAKDVEDQTDVDGEEKVLRAAILMAEATIRTVEEMKERRKYDAAVKNMGYKVDLDCEHRPIWHTANFPSEPKQVDKDKEQRFPSEDDHSLKAQAEPCNIQETQRLHEKPPKSCDTKTYHGKSKAEEDYLIGLTNNLIFNPGSEKTISAGEDELLKTFASEILLFVDQERESEQPCAKDFCGEKSTVHCAKRIVEEETNSHTSY